MSESGIAVVCLVGSWFGLVWFVIALGLFCSDSYRQVFRWLNRFRSKQTPGRSTLCESRKSVGVAPLRLLAEEVVRLEGRSEDAHSFYEGMRLMAIDSFVVDLADSPANERAFGRPGSGRAPGAFPQARVLSLCEAGTDVRYRSLIKPHRRSEVPMARYLLRFIEENMLLLWDRNFLSYRLVGQILARKAHLLARVKMNLIFKPARRLKDKSFLAKLYQSPRRRNRHVGGIATSAGSPRHRDRHVGGIATSSGSRRRRNRDVIGIATSAESGCELSSTHSLIPDGPNPVRPIDC